MAAHYLVNSEGTQIKAEQVDVVERHRGHDAHPANRLVPLYVQIFVLRFLPRLHYLKDLDADVHD